MGGGWPQGWEMLSPETDTLQALKSRPHVQKWLGSDERTVHSLTSPECTGGPQFENPGQSSRSFTFNINCWWYHYWTFWNAGAFFSPPGLGGAISCAWSLFPWGLGDPPLCTADPVSAMALLTKQGLSALCPLPQAQGLAACDAR